MGIEAFDESAVAFGFTGSMACTMVASVPVATTETRIVPVSWAAPASLSTENKPP